MRAVVVAAAVVAALLRVTPAAACPSCGCGVANPTRLGADIPFAGRARVGLVLTSSSLHEGDMALGASDLSVAGSFALTDFLVVEGAVPLSARFVLEPSKDGDDVDMTGRAVGLGDARLGARAVVFRDRSFAPRLMVATRAQVVVPTAPQLTLRGVPVAMGLQPGAGALAVNGSVAVLYRPISRLLLSIDVGGQTPLWTLDGASAGTTAQLQTSAQFDVTDVVSVRGTATGQATHAPVADHHGVRTASINERGAVFAGAGLAFTIRPEILAIVDVEVPVVAIGDPAIRDGARLTAGVVYDF